MNIRMFDVRSYGGFRSSNKDGWLYNVGINREHVVSWQGDTEDNMKYKYPWAKPHVKVDVITGETYNIEGLTMEKFNEWMVE